MIAYDGVIDRDTLVLQTRTLIAASGEMMFEAGKRLLVLKETLEHGSFLKALEEIGIGSDTALRFMNATLKLGSGSNSAALRLLPKSKLYELATLDDEYIKELNENGTVAGVQLDEFDRMTTRELRAKIRKLNEEKKADRESFERLLNSQKEAHLKDIKKLEKYEKGDKSLWTEQAKKLDTEILALSTEIVQRMGRLCDLCDQVKVLNENEPDYSTAPLHIRTALANVSSEICTWNNQFGAKVDLTFPGLRPGLQGEDGLGFGDSPFIEEGIDFDDMTEIES